MTQALGACLTTSTQSIHLFWFCLQVFRQAGPPNRIDCLSQWGNKRQVSFPTTHRRITISEIEAGASNISIINQTLCQLVCFVDKRFSNAEST